MGLEIRSLALINDVKNKSQHKHTTRIQQSEISNSEVEPGARAKETKGSNLSLPLKGDVRSYLRKSS